MKKLYIALITLGFASSMFAIDKAELDNRIRTLTVKFAAMQGKPDKRVPAESLRKAQGVVLLDRTKGGFIFGFESGHGVALVKDSKTQKWSAPAFMQSNEGSFGAQIGGQKTFMVILLMNTNAAYRFTEPNFDFGGEARGTAGNDSSGVEGNVNSPEPWVLVFDDRQGLFGGAAIKGGAIGPDNEANSIYYGQALSVNEILVDRKVQPTEAGAALAAKINECASEGGTGHPLSDTR